MRLEFYFDFSCPYAYLGSTQIAALAERHGVALSYRPMLLGGVFQARGTPQNMSEGMAREKAKHNLNDMHRWAALWDVPLTVPKSHPMRTVAALRALLAVDEAFWPKVIESIYSEYWTRGREIGDPAVLRNCLESAGLSSSTIEAAIAANDDPAIKNELRKRTDEAIERGVFGAPTIFAESSDGTRDMFWGQDRLVDLESYLTKCGFPADKSAGQVLPPIEAASTEPRQLEFYFDFSSPFAYLGSRLIEEAATRAKATLVWKPILLGALFREIGTADVPILDFSEAKRIYYRSDLERCAKTASIPFSWNPSFPIRTVTALRIALANQDRMAPFVHEAFAAVWRDQQDLNDPKTLTQVVRRAGLPDHVIADASSPEAKQALFAANKEAVNNGVFGAPTTIVRGPGQSTLFWGQDRIEMAVRSALGWSTPAAHPAAQPTQ